MNTICIIGIPTILGGILGYISVKISRKIINKINRMTLK